MDIIDEDPIESGVDKEKIFTHKDVDDLCHYNVKEQRTGFKNDPDAIFFSFCPVQYPIEHKTKWEGENLIITDRWNAKSIVIKKSEFDIFRALVLNSVIKKIKNPTIDYHQLVFYPKKGNLVGASFLVVDWDSEEGFNQQMLTLFLEIEFSVVDKEKLPKGDENVS